MAAVRPAGPDPTMITSCTSSTSSPLGVGYPQEEQAYEAEDSAHDGVADPHRPCIRMDGEVDVEGAGGGHGDEDEGHDPQHAGDQAVHQGAGHGREGSDRLVAE